jgi:hypothetical protein
MACPALDRIGDRRLNAMQQATVVAATRTPGKIRWPEWWETWRWADASAGAAAACAAEVRGSNPLSSVADRMRREMYRNIDLEALLSPRMAWSKRIVEIRRVVIERQAYPKRRPSRPSLDRQRALSQPA